MFNSRLIKAIYQSYIRYYFSNKGKSLNKVQIGYSGFLEECKNAEYFFVPSEVNKHPETIGWYSGTEALERLFLILEENGFCVKSDNIVKDGKVVSLEFFEVFLKKEYNL